MREVRQKVNDVDAIIWDAKIHCKWRVKWLMFAKDKVLNDRCLNSKEYVRGKIGKRREENKIDICLTIEKGMKSIHIGILV